MSHQHYWVYPASSDIEKIGKTRRECARCSEVEVSDRIALDNRRVAGPSGLRPATANHVWAKRKKK